MVKLDSVANRNFFKDAYGHIVIVQLPNITLCAWFLFKLISIILTKGQVKTGFELLSMAFLFTWAYIEMTKGVNYFRKLLGLIVIIVLIANYFY